MKRRQHILPLVCSCDCEGEEELVCEKGWTQWVGILAVGVYTQWIKTQLNFLEPNIILYMVV